MYLNFAASLDQPSTDGFNTWLCYWPQTRTTVAVLSNLNTVVTGPIAARLGDLAHDEASTLPSERKPIELPESALKSRAGSYASPEGRKHEIAFDDGKLYYQAGPAPKMELLPESAVTFFLRARDLVVKFTTGGLTILTGLDEVRPRNSRGDR